MDDEEINRINNDISLIRRLNIKIDIVNNHIKNLLKKTNIFIRGFSKLKIDKTINEITDNLEDLYIRRDEYKQEIMEIEYKYDCKNIYEYKYQIEKENKLKIII
jgi:hypothetical protein